MTSYPWSSSSSSSSSPGNRIIRHHLSAWTWRRQRKWIKGENSKSSWVCCAFQCVVASKWLAIPNIQPGFRLLCSIYLPSLLTHQSVTPAVRSIWANSTCTWKEQVYIHTSGKSVVGYYEVPSLQSRTATCCAMLAEVKVQDWPGRWRHGSWMRPSYSSPSRWGAWIWARPEAGRTRSCRDAQKRMQGGENSGSRKCRHKWRRSGSPLVVLGVMVPLLHWRFLFGALVFVWQQQEGDVAVHAVFAFGQQTSAQDNAARIFKIRPCSPGTTVSRKL